MRTMKHGMSKQMKYLETVLISALLFTVLISCPTPLSKAMAKEVMDSVAPVIKVVTPEDGDAFGAYTLITGKVSDMADGNAAGRVASLYVEILGVTGGQGVPVSDDGSFSVTLPTNGAGYSSDIVVKLTATDWNGNSSEITMALKKAAGEITGFTVTAGNRSAEISWDPLPGADSYILREYRSGESIDNITGTSYNWENLTNGSKCSFRVEAEIDGSVYPSEIEEAIPLAESTLVPNVESLYRGIKLSWKDIPAASEYVVERSENRSGPFSIRTITPDSTFLDNNLRRGEGFYYRVYPVERMENPDIAISEVIYGCAGYFHGRNDYSIFSSVDTGNSAFYTVVRDNYAYIADGTDGLWIADISDIYNPVIASSCNNTSKDIDGNGYGNARGVALSGDYAYVANLDSGMEIIYIHDKLNPYRLQLDSDDAYPYDYETHRAFGIDVFDREINSVLNHYACIADGHGGLNVINVTNNSKPVSGVSDSTEYAQRVVVDGNYIYLADSTAGVKIYQLGDQDGSLTITPKGTCSHSSDSQDVAVSGNYVYVADKSHGLNIFSVDTDRTNCSWEGNLDLANYAYGVTVSGTRAYVAESISGLSIINVSNPATPSFIATCDTPGDAHSVTVDGDYAFVADYNSGLQIIDISEPSALSIGGILSSTDEVRKVAISGNYAYITQDELGIKVVDISDPADLSVEGSWSMTGTNTKGIAVSGNYAYVADYDLGLQVIDISDPSHPVLVKTLDIKAETPGRSEDIAVSGSYAYVAEKENGLQVIDISDPSNPVLAGLCDTAHSACGVAVSRSYAYVADNDSLGEHSRLIVMDISDPDHPFQVGSFDTAGHTYGVSVSGHYVYVADGDSGLAILDISNPESITDTSPAYTLDTDGLATGVTISGSYAFVAETDPDGSGTETGWLQVIDISDPVNPVEVTRVATTDSEGVAVAGGYAYVADRLGGLKVVDLWDEN